MPRPSVLFNGRFGFALQMRIRAIKRLGVKHAADPIAGPAGRVIYPLWREAV
ncbi:hypothetical protein [Agrobacterium burrii]|uniref:Uncharacterized protein n=1 Tax=Agrobacterium burrii TaxID=2815339 RepID=A0ABS3EP55_9HYPH|nr:hypothetical protein [Agrobacterium burrii]MBO0133691.1 hypothetical protein [Agrobacterium burrii]